MRRCNAAHSLAGKMSYSSGSRSGSLRGRRTHCPVTSQDWFFWSSQTHPAQSFASIMGALLPLCATPARISALLRMAVKVLAFEAGVCVLVGVVGVLAPDGPRTSGAGIAAGVGEAVVMFARRALRGYLLSHGVSSSFGLIGAGRTPPARWTGWTAPALRAVAGSHSGALVSPSFGEVSRNPALFRRGDVSSWAGVFAFFRSKFARGRVAGMPRLAFVTFL